LPISSSRRAAEGTRDEAEGRGTTVIPIAACSACKFQSRGLEQSCLRLAEKVPFIVGFSGLPVTRPSGNSLRRG